MAKTNQETVTAFGEVVRSSNTAHTYCAANNTKNRTTSNDNRLMIYYQGMKLYIPDEFQSDALLQLLRTLKSYDETHCRRRKPHFSCLRQYRFPKTDSRISCNGYS